MIEVLFVHQSADLYGSDKVLFTLVAGIRDRGYKPLVLLPARGPLYDLLVGHGIETHVVELAKLSRATLSVGGALYLPIRLMLSLIQIRKVLRRRNVRIIYSNTLAILSGAVYAKLTGIRHVWHVHEIVMTPRVMRRAFPFLLRLMADRVIGPSRSVRQWLVDEQPALSDRISIIWNGVERLVGGEAAAATLFRQSAGAGPDDLVVTLVGRINRWKGQHLLVEAAELLLARGHRNLRFAMVGSAPQGQGHFRERLCERIDRSPARSAISLLDYAPNVWPIWDGTDIAVVPSCEPEPFGLVAIEAMASGRPVIAAAHGGLLDIICPDQQCGLLVRPGDAFELAAAIARLCDDVKLRLAIGAAGHRRQADLFTISAQIGKTVQCFEKLAAA